MTRDLDLTDIYGRQFKTLRLSLTNSCNLGCIYCVDETKKPSPSSKNILSWEQLVAAVKRLNYILNLSTIRLTGGEPTLFKDLLPLATGLKEIGISKIKMTTNGYLLKGKATQLFEAGITDLNISLDAVDQHTFFQVAGRKNLEKIMDGIQEALYAGVSVKLNTVIMKGVNDHQILPLLKFAQNKGANIRFLELMKMGHVNSREFERYFFSEREILEEIAKSYSYRKVIRQKSSTSNYWITEEGQVFGIIANESAPFCHDCNRLRLDSYGNIYGCLSEDKPISILNCLGDEEELVAKLKKALNDKQPLKFKGSGISMLAIGG